MATDRWVVVDDTNPGINYTAPWFQDSSGSLDNVGNQGSPYLHTLHGTITAGATAAFEFNGTGVWVRIMNTPKDPNPAFDCFVDNTSINKGYIDPRTGLKNDFYCSGSGLSDALHTLRIVVETIPESHTVWLDQLRYIPSPSLPLDNKTILLSNTDPAIKFDSQWESYSDGNLSVTTQKNSAAQVDFVGTSVSWIGWSPTVVPGAELHPGTASWKIDGGESTQFALLSSNTTVLLDQVFFVTPEVEAGPHFLTVTFLGDDQTVPLSLDYLLVKNGTFPAPTAPVNNNSTTQAPAIHGDNPGGSPSPATRDNNPASSRSGRNTPAIVGGVVGGVALLVLIIGAILFYQRRRKSKREGATHTEMEDLGHDFTPFTPKSNNFDPLNTYAHKPLAYHNSNIASTSSGTPTLVASIPPSGQQQSIMGGMQEAVKGAATTRGTNEVERAEFGNNLRPSLRPPAVTVHTNIGPQI